MKVSDAIVTCRFRLPDVRSEEDIAEDRAEGLEPEPFDEVVRYQLDHFGGYAEGRDYEILEIREVVREA